ncbi:RimJ/RimL family protein N-acetyltransferase [Catenuloplanes nepalensis]|uniref:RimJ/RimL family protein N-acetyltransferase n=1 Tax=Catenuloplanes nepalensis TaxID=587533 RepID=A0ABT9MS67_9ACTN|nr:hypothetical protein [Catenuloplanes nepalensis]MDP9794233.1 RimJ/RimL family protein N-acetyltransferase [Catenuloplanes nepalensis]
MAVHSLAGAALAAALGLSGVVAGEPRTFVGEGSSSFGLAYVYAQADALNQASWAGYAAAECRETGSVVWPGGYTATVWYECVRPDRP